MIDLLFAERETTDNLLLTLNQQQGDLRSRWQSYPAQLPTPPIFEVGIPSAGVGGRILVVTSSADSGTGTLRDAFAQVQAQPNTPTVIDIQVTTPITLLSALTLYQCSNFTITRLTPGVSEVRSAANFRKSPTLGSGVIVLHSCSNFIFEDVFLRAATPNDGLIGLGVFNCDHALFQHNVVVESTDETVSVFKGSHHLIFRYNVIGRALLSRFGLTITDDVSTGAWHDIVLYGNLILECQDRLPKVRNKLLTLNDRRIDIFNNIFYFSAWPPILDGGMYANFAGNVIQYRTGQNGLQHPDRDVWWFGDNTESYPVVWFNDNWRLQAGAWQTARILSTGLIYPGTIVLTPFIPLSDHGLLSAQMAYELVLAYAGIHQRNLQYLVDLIAEVRAGVGTINTGTTVNWPAVETFADPSTGQQGYLDAEAQFAAHQPSTLMLAALDTIQGVL